MAYTKTTWDVDTKVTTTNMNNLETQYDLALAAAQAHTHDTRYYTRTEMEAWFWYAGNDGAGSGCDADMLYYSGGNMHYADFSAAGVHGYLIVMWDTSSAPTGWVFCDGNNGTPDLREKFVIGAGGSYSVGASGGNNSWTQNYNITVAAHTLTTAELPAHTHDFSDAVAPQNGAIGGGILGNTCAQVSSTGTTGSAGSGGSHTHGSSYATINWTENKPPCVALHFIMKSP